ncbi:hypothetical protein [Flavobacterium anhuiense]|uniref:hypothetical protein n=1 Tax=Flavobacterium anhuiense TaxID=459526 RepID=UPI003D95E4BE
MHADIHDLNVVFVEKQDDFIGNLVIKGVGEIDVVGMPPAIATLFSMRRENASMTFRSVLAGFYKPAGHVLKKMEASDQGFPLSVMP